MRPFKIIPDWLRRLLRTPTEELTRWQYVVRFLLELCRHGARQLREDRAGQMAAALAFQTVFGLVPVTIIALVISRGLGGIELFKQMIRNLLEAAELYAVRVPSEEGGAALGDWLNEVVTDVSEGISGRTIGVVGSLVLAWAAISLLTTVERCFNQISDAPQHRPLQRRLPLYFTTIILGPLLVSGSFYVTAQLGEIRFGGASGEWIISSLTSFGMTWLFLLGLYTLMPNARTNTAAAGLGAFIAALLWTIVKHLFSAYIAVSFGRGGTFSIVYGALGFIPVFLLWIFVLWLIVLFGMEVTRILQVVNMRMDQKIPQRPQLPPVVDPASILPVMRAIVDCFNEGQATNAASLSETTHVNERAIELMLSRLLAEGLLHEVNQDDHSYVLARPPERIQADELIRIGLSLTGEDSESEQAPVWCWVKRLRQAQLEATAGKTLAEL